jgi:antitoxin (DNA-binding transcriptional repressor) of toxin-antitoxin stability system
MEPIDDVLVPTSVHAAKTQLSRLIERALAGEDVVIGRGRKPLVRLVPVAQVKATRSFGGYQGEWFMADDFDDELADFAEYMPLPATSTPVAAEPKTGYGSLGKAKRGRKTP